MHFRISDTFTDSLSRLTADEQKAVKITAFDLQKTRPIRACSCTGSKSPRTSILNLPLLNVPLSHSIMRPSFAVPRASFSQTASD
jgi:hypothetical protein